MEKLTLTEISRLCNGRLEDRILSRGNFSSEMLVRGVSIDSREIGEGDLFVALQGERFNGHDFLREAAQKGAVAAMVEAGEMMKRESPVPVVFVDDSVAGLQNMARAYRSTLRTRTVAVAGSNGKTGTKEMVAAVLGTRFSVLKNKGNLNNHIGVPLSLMRLGSSHQIGVFEVGTNHPGELIQLLNMVQPLAGIITTIGEEHLEYFHDLEGVAKEEGTLAEALPEDGLLALNADNEWSPAIARRCRARKVYFGFAESAQYRGTAVCVSTLGTHFRLVTPLGTQEIALRLIGRYQVANALAAAAVGEFFGLDLEQIRQGLESVMPEKMRMERSMTSNGVLILNDAYNANPGSMLAALEVVEDLTVEGRRFAVLGEMRELGKTSGAAHHSVGARAAESGIDVLVVVGSGAQVIVDGARAAKRQPSQIAFFQDPEGARNFLRGETHRGDLVLIKASRGVALERILEGWN